MNYRIALSSAQLWLEQHRQLLLRLAIVAALLLVSTQLAPRAADGHRLSILILLLFPVAAVAVLLLKWPAVGLVAVIAGNLYVPYAVPTGTGNSLGPPLLIVSFLSAVWLVDMVVRQKQIRIVQSRVLLALSALVAVVVLAFGTGQLPWFPLAERAPLSAQLAGLSVYGLSALVCVLAAHQVRDLRWLKTITWAMVILGSIFVVGRMIPGLGAEDWLPRGAKGSLFYTWFVALAFSQAVLNRNLRPFWRLSLVGLAVTTLVANWVYSRHWASGWVPPLVAVLAIVWLRSWRLGLLVMVVGTILALAFGVDLHDSLLARNEYSISTRWVAWQIVGEITLANPLLGLGPANYYYYTPLFPILGWYVRFNSHSQYIDLIAQAGFLGMACFVWLAAEVAKLGWRLRARVAEGFSQAYVYGALAGLAGMLVAGFLGDWLFPFVYNTGFNGLRASLLGWLFLGGLVALEQMTRERPV